MGIIVGQMAPDFTLFDSEKNEVTLSGFRGQPVVVLFFPFAFSSVCTAELCSVRDDMAIYQNVGAKVLGISVDSLYALKRFKEDQGISFTLLSDFNKEVSSAYGSLYEVFGYNMRGVSKRSAFVIDGKGRIVFAEVLENAGQQPDFQAIKLVLEQLSQEPG